MLGPTSTMTITMVGGSTRKRKGTAMVLDLPSPLQVDGAVEPTSSSTSTSTHTSTPTHTSTSTSPADSKPPHLYTTTHLHLHTSTPYTTTSTSTKAPTRPPVGPQWPPPPGPWACGPDNPDNTCTLCGANPWDLDYSTAGWD